MLAEKNRVRNQKSLGLLHLIGHPQPVQPQCRWYHPKDVYRASTDLAVRVMRLDTCRDKLER